MLVQKPPANGLALLQMHYRHVDDSFDDPGYKVLKRPEKSNMNEQEPDSTNQGNGLRMETFFELMVLDERVQFDPGVTVVVRWGREAQKSIWVYGPGIPIEHSFGRRMMTFDIVVTLTNYFHGNYCKDTRRITNEEERYQAAQIFGYYKTFNPRVKPRATKQVVHVELEQYQSMYDL
ncbi:hypothetical protein N7481_012801 [Penicillium waksmanii]|uniref:uncharacterized protein n=1 Tax=Penicillium waksmanii TaxID=69791 RepID=UPI0025494F50|nr:uncharacterized protein N7481_012801 [Penicillium waksmanii]KAJ5966087.1 hypothetical protein N7481_012801 [Penicillium waksmanii]